VLGGVFLGGAAAWLRQSRWRRAARRAQIQARELRAELERLKLRRGAMADSATGSPPADYAPRLTIPPPAA
jgi:hypothetical protein